MKKKGHQSMRSWGSCLLLGASLLGLSQLAEAMSPADPNKVLRYVFPTAETGFDPAGVDDLYSSAVLNGLFETLYTYDYLASPSKIIPRTATALPDISDGGKTYTIHLQKGIYFIPDPAFGGKPRELTAKDYVYSFERLLDPAIHSQNSWLLDGKIEGMDALVAQAKKTGHFDYDAPLVGLQTPDRYTLVIHLTKPDYNLPLYFAHEQTSAVAREVVEKYRDKAGRVMGHPVGTGPYMLTKWVPGSEIVLTANPDYRGFVWDFKASSPADQPIVDALKGKRMPQIGVIDIKIMEENQSRLLAFQKDEVDMFQLEGELIGKALDNLKLKPELAKKGVQLSTIIDPEISYIYWNMQDPVVGGMSKEKIALRRAIAMAHNIDQEIKVVWNSNAVKLNFPIPVGILGHDPSYVSSIPYSVKAANLLLDRYHYNIGKDGYRTLPNSKPLVITYTSRNDSLGLQQGELWKKTFDALHIHMKANPMLFSDELKAQRQCKTQFGLSAWYADYPDGQDFMQLFYGPNIGQTNYGCSADPTFDRLYEQAVQMPDGAERDVLFHKMARLMEVNTTAQVSYGRYRHILSQPRVIGYKKHPILTSEWMYFDIKPRQ